MKPHFHARIRFKDEQIDNPQRHLYCFSSVEGGEVSLVGSKDGACWGTIWRQDDAKSVQWQDHDGNWHDFEEATDG